MAVIAALILGVYLYRQKGMSASTPSTPDTQAHESTDTRAPEPKPELYGSPLHEVEALSQPSELQSRQEVPSELPSRQAVSSGMHETR